MSFAVASNLWLAIAAPVAMLAFLWHWRRQLGAMAAWASASLWSRLEVIYSTRRLTAAVATFGIAVLCTSLALARPRWGSIEQRVERQGVDVVFVLDSSLSMQARDVLPARLDIAKALVRQMVHDLPGHRTALVQAEGKGLVLSPLTVDTAVVDLLLDTVFPASLPDPGTRLESALGLALRLFPPEGEKHRALVVVSDGEDHGSNWKETIRKVTEAGVVVHFVGIGTRGGSPIELAGAEEVRYKQDSKGQIVISKLQPDILEGLSTASGGLFVEVDSAGVEATQVVRAINAMKKRTLDEETLDVAAERFQWPLAIAALAISLHLALPPLASTGQRGALER